MSLTETELLRQILSQKYDFSFFSLELQGEKFDLATVTNIDQLYDDLIAKGPEHEDFIDERIPYWADLWHSGIGLADYLLDSGICKGKTVLEIGCGLGLPGIAAARSGGQVLMTDYLPEALEVTRLIWKMNIPIEPRLEVLDWRYPDPAMASDILLASDVVYEARNIEPLLEAFDVLLKPGGTIILSDPGRPLSRKFVESLAEKKYSLKETLLQVPFRDVLTKVYIFEIGRN
ncbi:MAG: 50S ribosomal protein L11 methyltransferase [Bacteroidia bacterium]|nr:50S ribosomal protein L11 methyltransferase [Bacteroidia bacterium]